MEKSANMASLGGKSGRLEKLMTFIYDTLPDSADLLSTCTFISVPLVKLHVCIISHISASESVRLSA